MFAAAADQTANESTSFWVLFIGGFFTLAGVSITAVFGYLGHRQAKVNGEEVKEINNAVNHKAADQLRLFDMVAETHERTSVLSDGLASLQRNVDNRLDRLERQKSVAHRGFEDHLGLVESKVDDTAERLQSLIAAVDNEKGCQFAQPVHPPTFPNPPQEAPE